jgi:hypothetical protein
LRWPLEAVDGQRVAQFIQATGRFAVSYSTELAAAARRVRALAEQLPEQLRPDVVAEWSDLLDDLDGKSDRAARAAIACWLERMETRLASALANAPHV